MATRNSKMIFTGVLILLISALTWTMYAQFADQIFKTYDPPNGRGPLIIILPGSADGPDNYIKFASEIAQLGYYTVLLNGNSFDPSFGYTKNIEDRFRHIVEQAQSSPKAIPGKAAVIGFSMGGGAALTYAAGMSDLITTIIVYYPLTWYFIDMDSSVARFKLPILVLAGEKDRFWDCCTIESMYRMKFAAEKKGVEHFELVVYPNAEHFFILTAYSEEYRPDDAADAWQRTKNWLAQYHPIP